MQPELVIFDCDGVLVDSETVSNEVLARNLTRHGLEMTTAECMSHFVGGTMKSVGEKASDWGADLPADWIDQIYGEIYARLRQGVPAIAGVVNVLDRIDRAGIPFCVASNGSEEKMSITLGHTGLLSRFETAMFSAHTLGVAKPDPGLYLHAANTFGISPEFCAVIEDSLSGVTAARRAGMKCYGYSAHDDGAGLAEEGAEVFHDMAELAGLLGI